MRQAHKASLRPRDLAPEEPMQEEKPICPTTKSKRLISTCKFAASPDPDSNPKQSVSVNFQGRRNPHWELSLTDGCTAAPNTPRQEAAPTLGLGLCVLPSLHGHCQGPGDGRAQSCSIINAIFSYSNCWLFGLVTTKPTKKTQQQEEREKP